MLEIGCNCGGTLLRIKNEYKNANVFGVETNCAQANIAKEFATINLADNLENLPDYSEGYFDYIILIDIINKILDPVSYLAKLQKLLKPQGKLILRAPNLMNIETITNVLTGWGLYGESGLQAASPIRFFSHNDMTTLLSKSGYKKMLWSKTLIPRKTKKQQAVLDLLSENLPDLKEVYETQYYVLEAYPNSEILTAVEEIMNGYNIEENIEKLSDISINEINTLLLDQDGKIDLLNCLATVFFSAKRYDNVLPFLEKALEINPHHKDTVYNLAFVLHNFGENDLALKYISQLQDKDEEILDLENGIQAQVQASRKAKQEIIFASSLLVI